MDAPGRKAVGDKRAIGANELADGELDDLPQNGSWIAGPTQYGQQDTADDDTIDNSCSKGEYSTSQQHVNCTNDEEGDTENCLLYTSPSPRDLSTSRMPSSA